MVHTSFNLTDRGSDDLFLWLFAAKHSVCLYNHLLNKQLGLTPLEILTRSKYDYRDLIHSHVWGCPVFVLKPKLQNDHNPPKCNQRSRLGQLIGFSDGHSSLVDTVRHVRTGYISPWFHLDFDDLFETVIHPGDDDSIIEATCSDIFDINRDWYAREYFDNDGNIIYRPPNLHDNYLDQQGHLLGEVY